MDKEVPLTDLTKFQLISKCAKLESELKQLQSTQSEAVDKGALLKALKRIHDLFLKKQYKNGRVSLGGLIYSIESDDEFLKVQRI